MELKPARNTLNSLKKAGEMTFTPKWFYVFVSPVGLKYAGQTIRGNPGVDYFGSGKRWLRHINIHGKPTILVKEWCNTVEEFQSKLNELPPNYFNSRDSWANLKSETPWDNYLIGSEIGEHVKEMWSLNRRGVPKKGMHKENLAKHCRNMAKAAGVKRWTKNKVMRNITETLIKGVNNHAVYSSIRSST